ncbi:MAG: fumarate hydratase C-terminal domain-containing protein, partial [Endomicrobiia bacterium]|nr:fumarate hydratase C-terminal domain-containing protein [Endomicrobiia bacterium]
GPTTSGRMAFGIPFLVRRGARIFIGKGPLPTAAALAVARAGGLYLTAVGGCGAYYSRFVKSVRTVAFDELGPEAALKLELDSMPLKVALSPQNK